MLRAQCCLQVERMKKLFWFLLLFGCLLQSFGCKKPITSAIREVARNLFMIKSRPFDLFSHGLDSEGIVEQIIKFSRGFSPIQVMKLMDNDDSTWFNRSTVLLFDSFESFKKKHSKFMVNRYKINTKELVVVVYITDLKEKDLNYLKDFYNFKTNMEAFTNSASQTAFRFSMFIIEKKNGFDLVTFELYKQPNCSEWTRTDINSFSSSRMAWKTRKFHLEKFATLNGCDVDVALGETFDDVDSGSLHQAYTRIPMKILEELSDHLNYSLRFGNYSGVRDVVMFVSPLKVVASVESIAIVPSIYFSSDVYFFVTRSELYTPFEKLFLAFELEVWIWLIVTFSIALVTIVVVKVSSMKAQKFLFGSRVTHPMLNLAIGWFGGAQTTLPERNFPRYLLICYLFFCLIMRTAYQGKLYVFNQTEMRKPDVTTIEEIISQRYIYVTCDQDFRFIDDFEFILRLQTRDFKISEVKDFKKFVLETPKIAISSIAKDVWGVDKTNSTFTRLSEKIIAHNYVFCLLYSNDLMYPILTLKIGELFEAGLGFRYVDEIIPQYRAERIVGGPVVFNFYHLSAGFKVFLFFLALSFACFILEILTKASTTALQLAIKRFVMEAVLQAFHRMRVS